MRFHTDEKTVFYECDIKTVKLIRSFLIGFTVFMSIDINKNPVVAATTTGKNILLEVSICLRIL